MLLRWRYQAAAKQCFSGDLAPLTGYAHLMRYDSAKSACCCSSSYSPSACGKRLECPALLR